MKIDKTTLLNISSKISSENNFSTDIKEKEKQKNQSLYLINEPIRRFEFNILLSICANTYQPFDKMEFEERTYSVHSSHNLTTVVTVPKKEVLEYLDLLENNNMIQLATLKYNVNGKYVEFELKDSFRRFDNGKFLNSDTLYQKLYGLGIDSKIKALYYFISMYKYDFINVVSDYKKVYNELSIIDDYFCRKGYHKRITEKSNSKTL